MDDNGAPITPEDSQEALQSREVWFDAEVGNYHRVTYRTWMRFTLSFGPTHTYSMRFEHTSEWAVELRSSLGLDTFVNFLFNNVVPEQYHSSAGGGRAWCAKLCATLLDEARLLLGDQYSEQHICENHPGLIALRELFTESTTPPPPGPSEGLALVETPASPESQRAFEIVRASETVAQPEPLPDHPTSASAADPHIEVIVNVLEREQEAAERAATEEAPAPPRPTGPELLARANRLLERRPYASASAAALEDEPILIEGDDDYQPDEVATFSEENRTAIGQALASDRTQIVTPGGIREIGYSLATDAG